MIGHANGVVTIDLAETMDAYRERSECASGNRIDDARAFPT